MDELKTLGKNIRRLRRSADFTQSELGLKIDLSKDSLSKLELGKLENPGIKYLIRICRELDTSMGELFFEEGQLTPFNLFISKENVPAIKSLAETLKRLIESK